MADKPNELGERIKQQREARHLTQAALGAIIGVTGRTIGNWERGETVPRNRLGALEVEFGIDLSTGELLDLGDDVYRAVISSGLSKAAQHELLGLYERLRAQEDSSDTGSG